MKTNLHFLVATVCLGMFLCFTASAQKVSYDSVPGTDFSKYKTYKWQRAEKAKYPDPENDRLLMRAIDAQLGSKGLTKVETEEADVYVIYQLAILDNVEWSSFRSDIGWSGSGANSLPGFRGGTTNSVMPIKSGSLILDIYDVSQKKRVWQAHATKTVDPSAELKKREKNVQKVMAKIMQNYPPVSK